VTFLILAIINLLLLFPLYYAGLIVLFLAWLGESGGFISMQYEHIGILPKKCKMVSTSYRLISWLLAGG
jgi:hypothetical protein